MKSVVLQDSPIDVVAMPHFSVMLRDFPADAATVLVYFRIFRTIRYYFHTPHSRYYIYRQKKNGSGGHHSSHQSDSSKKKKVSFKSPPLLFLFPPFSHTISLYNMHRNTVKLLAIDIVLETPLALSLALCEGTHALNEVPRP